MSNPRIGRKFVSTPQGGAPAATSNSALDDLVGVPKAEVMGEIKAKGPGVTAWEDPETKRLIEIEEGPAPWEVNGGIESSDARNFIACPDTWVLYWINPKMLDATGWRGWTHVRAKDPRVRILVTSMVTPEGMVRRGGPTGDILAYMPKHWYESRKEQYKLQVARQTQSSIDRFERLKEQVNRGGPNGLEMHLEGRHPTHTIADLKGATD